MIKRWDINEPHVELSEWDNGDFVWYTDYQKLEAENTRLRQALEEIKDIVGSYPEGVQTSVFQIAKAALEVEDDK